jgi:hypothetical protein
MTIEIILWALVLGFGVWGVAAKDWRASIGALVCAVVAFALLIAHGWR